LSLLKKTSSLLNVFLIAIIIAGCCNEEPVEEAKLLSDSEKQLIPYQLNETISFKYSEGYEFEFTVIERSSEYRMNGDNHLCPKIYVSREVEDTILKGNYPRIDIKFSQLVNDGKIYLSINSQFLVIEYDSAANIIESSEQKLLESIEVNNKTYYSVLDKEFYVPSNVDSVNGLYFKSILYNKQYGLIQLKTSKNETYSIY